MKKNLFLLLSVAVFAISANAQVTIGSLPSRVPARAKIHQPAEIPRKAAGILSVERIQIQSATLRFHHRLTDVFRQRRYAEHRRQERRNRIFYHRKQSFFG